ncbi:hypothetical protein P4S64_03010, partial [Vibrio sp. M60_M31a]
VSLDIGRLCNSDNFSLASVGEKSEYLSQFSQTIHKSLHLANTQIKNIYRIDSSDSTITNILDYFKTIDIRVIHSH